MTCGANGDWYGTPPICMPTLIDCGAPLFLNNGTVSASNTTYGGTATYTCDFGYTLIGSDTMTCVANGTWIGTLPSCAIIDCGSSGPDPANGWVLTPSGTTFLQVAEYHCNTGYVIVGADLRVCESHGTWNDTEPTRALTCPPLLAPTNGGVDTLQGRTVRMAAKYNCAAGYALQDPETRICLTTADWDGMQPNYSYSETISCHKIGQTEQSKIKMKTVGAVVLQGFSPLLYMTNINVVRCVRMCVERMRVDCGLPGSCHVIQYHDNSKSCDLYHADAYGRNITCNMNNRCYKYEN